MNYKNLNSEIETKCKGAGNTSRALSTMNYKNLNSEIETCLFSRVTAQ